MVSRYFDGKSAAKVRSRERGRRSLAAGLRVLAAMAVMAAGVAAVWRFRLHTVRSVAVSGGGYHAEAMGRSLSPCLGRPLWSSGAAALAAAYEKAHPEVERVRTAALPWGVLAAEARLRAPLARVGAEGLVIDAQGVVFRASAGRSEDLPQLRLSESTEAGRRRALTALMTAGVCEPSWTIDCSDQSDIKLTIPGKAVVRLGNGRFPDKWARLREIIGDRELPIPCVIDLRFHGQAAVRGQV